MRPLLKAAIDLYSRRWGGEQITVDTGLQGSGIPTQVFNAQAHKRQSDTVMLFLPGFASLPNRMNPGVLLKTAQELGWDFARFYHPDMILNPQRLNYGNMIHEAAQVASALPQRRIVLAGSSFGAGMMPFVADRVNEEQLGRVSGMFGWSAVTPKALMALFDRQDDEEQARFHAGQSKALEVVTPTLPKPFHVSKQQYDSVAEYAKDGMLVGVSCPSFWITGDADPVGKPQYTRDLHRQMPKACVVMETVEAGHRMKPELIRRGVRMISKVLD